MRRLLIQAVLLSMLSALGLGSLAGASSDHQIQIPVLVYHHLTRNPAESDANTMYVVEFSRQIDWLYKSGYQSITTTELEDWLEGRIQLPAKSVLITFDDGYTSVYDLAWPILRAYGFKATVFVVSSQFGQTPGWLPHLTATQMNEMHRSGLIEIQEHSFDGHYEVDEQPVLTLWSPPEIGEDLAAGLDSFKEAGLPRPHAFAYPYGAWTPAVVEELQTAGYRLGFTGEQGFVGRGDHPLLLKRIVAYPGMRL